MKVFKFGGASVKSAHAVQNVKSILEQYSEEKLIVVVSAMGKTTNAMEGIVDALFSENSNKFTELIEEVQSFHLYIINELFPDKDHVIYKDINLVFDKLAELKNQPLTNTYDYNYDQVVSLGEIISSKIIAAFLSEHIENICWKDARSIIRTDNKFRSANVDWGKTQELIISNLQQRFCRIIVTQGFIGHTANGETTTLGREGSDFTAGIIAYCLNATSVTIWKDVPGMLNADPKFFKNTVKLDKISFKEAIELAYYGASVIHPKTIKPLQNKNIPLFIKSFLEPNLQGSVIQQSTKYDDLVPSFIFKTKQVLLSVTSKDFSFIVEENLSDIFKKLSTVGGHINLMQNSAVSFTVCLDISEQKLNSLIELLKDNYLVLYNENVELVTIRHYNQATIDRITGGKEILMEQKTRHTVRIVMK